MLNRKVTAGPTEATAIGNVLAQLIALKEISDVNQAREVVKRSFPTEEYLPEDTGVWEDAYDRYLQIIENPVG